MTNTYVIKEKPNIYFSNLSYLKLSYAKVNYPTKILPGKIYCVFIKKPTLNYSKRLCAGTDVWWG